MRFARLLAKRVPVGVLAGSGLRALAQGRHGLLDRREHVAILARAALDEGIPPALAIGETRDLGQFAEGIAPNGDGGRLAHLGGLKRIEPGRGRLAFGAPPPSFRTRRRAESRAAGR